MTFFEKYVDWLVMGGLGLFLAVMMTICIYVEVSNPMTVPEQRADRYRRRIEALEKNGFTRAESIEILKGEYDD